MNHEVLVWAADASEEWLGVLSAHPPMEIAKIAVASRIDFCIFNDLLRGPV